MGAMENEWRRENRAAAAAAAARLILKLNGPPKLLILFEPLRTGLGQALDFR